MRRKKTPSGIAKIALSLIALCFTTGCMITGKPSPETKPENTGSTIEQPSETAPAISEQISPAAKWAMNTMLDTDIPDLDYASNDRVIFHGYFGLFVYDLQAKKLTNSLDLKELEIQKVQTGGPCRVLVSDDGNLVYLYPYDTNYMYTYDIKENSVHKTSATEPLSYFKGLEKSRDILSEDGLKIQFCSANTVSFHDGSHGYLYLNGGSLADVVYQRAGEVFNLLTEKDKPAPTLLRQDESYYRAYQMKALESYEDFLYAYQTMYALKDYAGLCSLSKGIDYSDEMQKEWQGYVYSIAWGEEINTTENRSCYRFVLNQNNNRTEVQEEKYLYIKKDETGWYADCLPQSIPPDDNWWSN